MNESIKTLIQGKDTLKAVLEKELGPIGYEEFKVVCLMMDADIAFNITMFNKNLTWEDFLDRMATCIDTYRRCA